MALRARKSFRSFRETAPGHTGFLEVLGRIHGKKKRLSSFFVIQNLHSVENYEKQPSLKARGFVNVFSRRETGFHRRAKASDPTLLGRKTVL